MLIVCCISILSWFIAAQGHETDPDCNDYLTSKWLGLIRPLVAGFHSPLTAQVGFAEFDGVLHAALWSGTAASYFNLQEALNGAGYVSSQAYSVRIDGTDAYVVGEAVTSSGSPHAMLWKVHGFQLPNHPPVARNDTLGTTENRPVAAPVVKLLANDTDPDGDSLAITAVSASSMHGGTVLLTAGVVTYTPAMGFAGDDRFTYTVGDGRGGTAEGTVAVTVTPSDALSLNLVAIKVEGHRRVVRFAGIPGQS